MENTVTYNGTVSLRKGLTKAKIPNVLPAVETSDLYLGEIASNMDGNTEYSEVCRGLLQYRESCKINTYSAASFETLKRIDETTRRHDPKGLKL